YRYRLSTRRFIYDVFDVNLAILHQELIDRQPAVTSDSQLLPLLPTASGSGHMSRRFSSSSQHFLHTTAGEIQRKRASTLQEFSASQDTLFQRRPTNGLLDDIRPAVGSVVRRF
ncbi:hypothetical protein IWW38_004811, partial [Coemansia aciculifera]